MGSVKDLVITGWGEKWYTPPKKNEFGRGAWQVKGTFSVKDIKSQSGESTIKNKAEMLTMTSARFFEWLDGQTPKIPTCYIGLLDKNNNLVDTETLLDKGETSSRIVMKLAHVPETLVRGI